MKKLNPAKEHYQRLRALSCEELWSRVVPAFARASGRERLDQVAVVRAVGVVFSESGTPEQREQARQWLRSLLRDPEEKIRRYAMTALPKIGVSGDEEAALLALLPDASSERETKSVGRTLEKIGGAATLGARGHLDARTVRKVEANVARSENPGTIRLDGRLENPEGVRIHLRCRAGLEEVLEQEVGELARGGGQFRIIHREKGRVTIVADEPFTLADLYSLRCFDVLGFSLEEMPRSRDELEGLAAAIAAPAMQRVLAAFTEGPVRYRLEFISKGHQRHAVRQVADRVYARQPSLLNDSRNALWQFNIRSDGSVELTPRLRPDPRFAYRLGDVPAASHPPLAASMARLAGSLREATVWDPFCGSGVELIESAMRGGVRRLFGTDVSSEAITVSRENIAAAGLDSVETILTPCDFRDYNRVAGLDAGSVDLVISNPPLGQRVPIPNLGGLMEDLFAAAIDVLRPGGKLIFVNPGPVKPNGRLLRLESRRKVDVGVFHCQLECHVRTAELVRRR